jgi:hypothetical protein
MHQHVLLPMSSAFECTFLRDMDSLISMTNVPKSKVSPLQKSPNLQPSPMPFIFGNGVILTYHDVHQHDYNDEQLHLYFQIEHNRCLFLAHLNQFVPVHDQF